MSWLLNTNKKAEEKENRIGLFITVKLFVNDEVLVRFPMQAYKIPFFGMT